MQMLMLMIIVVTVMMMEKKMMSMTMAVAMAVTVNMVMHAISYDFYAADQCHSDRDHHCYDYYYDQLLYYSAKYG